MKKAYLTVFLCLITTIFYGQKFQAGLKAGANLSTLKNESSEYYPYESKFGIRIGGHMSIKLKGKMSFGTELLYSQDGANFKNSDNQLELHRLSIPVLIKYTVVEIITFEIGPEINLLLSSKPNFPQYSYNDTIDYGGSFGLEIKPFDKLGIRVRNYFGLKYHNEMILRDELGVTTKEVKTDRNNVFSLTVNYYLK